MNMSTSERASLLQEAEKEESKLELEKKITLFNAIGITVGSIIGGGIFLAPTGVQQAVGSPALSLIVWALTCVMVLVCGLCLAELGSTIVESGGIFIYYLRIFGPFVAFMYLWINLFVIQPITAAVDLITLATSLLQPFFPTCDPPFYAVRFFSGVTLMLVVFVNCRSVRLTTVTQDFLSVVKILACFIIIVPGILSLVENGCSEGSFTHPWDGSKLNFGSFVMAFYSSVFAFDGFDIMTLLVEEMTRPSRDLVYSLCISLSICSVIFLLMNISYYAILTPNEIASTDAIADTFGDKALRTATWLVPLLVVLSILGSMIGTVLGASRLTFVASREQQLPIYLAMISPHYVTPLPSVALIALLTCAYLCVENVFELVIYFSFMTWLNFSVVAAGLLYLRHKQPDLKRPFKMNVFVVFLFCVICLVFVAALFYMKPKEALVGVGVLLTSVPAYFIFVYISPEERPLFVATSIQKATCFLQKLFPVSLTTSHLERILHSS